MDDKMRQPTGKCDSERLYTVCCTGRYGAIDSHGRIVLKPRFELLSAFKDGFAPFCREGKWGLIDATGSVVVSPQYDSLAAPAEGRCLVERGGLYGYVGLNGSVLTPTRFAEAQSFAGGRSPVRPLGSNLFGYLSSEGELSIQPRFISADPFSEGYAAVRDRLWGYIDVAGNPSTESVFTMAFPFSEGLAAVGVRAKGRNRLGFIDPIGRLSIAAEFDGADVRFSEGLAAVWKRGQYGFIDRTGRLVIKYSYYDVDAFSAGLCRATVRTRRTGRLTHGFIDVSGEFAIEPRFDWAESFDGPLAAVGIGDLLGYVNKAGEYVWEPRD